MGARVLVIEDNRTNRDLMTYLLRAFGHEPSAMPDGQSGLEAATSDDYDLIVSDVLMPRLDGFELARLYKLDGTRRAPLVAVTALAMVGDRERLLAAGFDGYIAKPIDPETFVKQVEAYLPPELRARGVPQGAATSAPAKRSRSSGPLVLAVDDLQVNLDVIAEALIPFGYRIAKARNIHSARERIVDARPAAILCDVHMPGGDGFELLRELKASAELHDIPFLFLSSTAWRASDKLRGLQLGAREFLLRPIDPRSLAASLEKALAEAPGGDGSDR
ncbi:MAG: response regulator [Candidatus Eremiobacteraeota bacterium]|nr:response regulator [Candidatus Eremiobacteraeota bacterium]